MTLPIDEIPSQIVPMILYRIEEHLTDIMLNEVPDDNPTKAILIKVGRFQDNPVQKNISVSISGGDYENPDYLDGRVDHSELDQIGLRYLPVGEVGGGIYWWRRGTCDFKTFFVRQRYEEDVALRYAYDFYGRLMYAVKTAQLGGLTDEYGEMANGTPYIESSSFFESGGNKQYIWRGKLYWRVLTWRP